MKRHEAMEVFKLEHDKFKDTRAIQWKFNLSLWTLLAFAIYSKKQLGFASCFSETGCEKICFDFSCVFLMMGGLLVVCIQYIWARKTQFSLEASKAIKSQIVENLMNGDLEDIEVNLVQRPKVAVLDPWVLLQAGIAFLLVALFVTAN